MLRFTRKQKTRFLHFLENFAKSQNWSGEIETDGSVRNFIVGNPDTAKYIFTAHYDTPIKSLFPFVRYPQSRLRTAFSKYLIIFVTLFCFVLLSYLLEFPLFRLILSVLYVLFLLITCIRLWIGPANRENWNSNTSGVALLMQLMQTLNSTNRKKTAFIFLDNRSYGEMGTKLFSKRQSANCDTKLIIDIDSVGVGDHILLLTHVSGKNAILLQELAHSVKKHAVKRERTCLLIQHTKHCEKNSFSKDTDYLGIRAVKSSENRLDGIRNIGTDADDRWEDDNLQLLTQALRAFVEKN